MHYAIRFETETKGVYRDKHTTITITFNRLVGKEWFVWTPDREKVIMHLRAIYKDPFKEAKDDTREFWEHYLESLKPLSENKWQAVIVEPTTD